MNFIRVTGTQCDSDGNKIASDGVVSGVLRINIDLISVITIRQVVLKSGKPLKVGKNYFTNLRLHKDVKLEDL